MLNLMLSGRIGLIEFITLIFALIITLSIHEFSHGFIAYKLGDPTARLSGRLTLNPLAHLDPLGTISLLLFGFGWGKPVPINPLNLKNIKRDSALIAFAGPASNFLLALTSAALIRLIGLGLGELIYSILILFIYFNLMLGVFNLLPLGPLDGFKIVAGLLPTNLSYQWQENEQLSFLILIALVLLPIGGVPIINFILNPILIFLFNLLTGTSLF